MPALSRPGEPLLNRFVYGALFAVLVFAATVFSAEKGTGAKGTADEGLDKARAAYASGQYKEAEDKLTRWLRTHAKEDAAEEALVLLSDAQVRLGRYESASKTVQRFRKAYSVSLYISRIAFVQALVHLKGGRNAEAARAYAAALRGARTEAFHAEVTRALRSLVEAGVLTPEELRPVFESVQGEISMGPFLLERLAEDLQRGGKFSAARQAYEDYLRRYPKSEGAPRVRERLASAKTMASQRRTLLVMGPMTGDYADVGRSQKEGVTLAIEEGRAKSSLPVELAYVDDAGDMMKGVERLRKAMQQEPFDAIIGPAMSDVSAAVAVDLSARQSPIPMITPTATTHGIAGLGEGVFQLNVTTLTLGQSIGTHAVDCMKLKDFIIVAPKSEYGYQLAGAFTEAVEQAGGKVHATEYYDADAIDLAPVMGEVRKDMIKVAFDQRHADGISDPEPKLMRSYQNDSTFSIDAFFLPSTHGEEAYRVASQLQFTKLRGQFLGSSGWYDKALLMKSSPVSQGAVFSIDFPDNPKTEVYQNFSRAYQARWRRAPDRVAALSYDATRMMLEGFSKSSKAEDLIPSLKALKSFDGVLGPIAFDEKSGANQRATLMRIDKKSFKDAPACIDSTANSTATKNRP